jgi:DNA-directed RNA polymerase specialized sigma24 family protein
LRNVSLVVRATADEMLRSIRAGEPSGTFLDMVVQKARLALTPVPPPNGMTWREEDVDQVAGDLIEEKWLKFVAVAWELETDFQLRAWTAKVARNYARDLGRATPRGRLTRRVERIIADLDDVCLDSRFVLAPAAAGHTSANDRDGLLAPLWDIAITTSWWDAPGDEDPTPGDREDLIALIRRIVENGRWPSGAGPRR